MTDTLKWDKLHLYLKKNPVNKKIFSTPYSLLLNSISTVTAGILWFLTDIWYCKSTHVGFCEVCSKTWKIKLLVDSLKDFSLNHQRLNMNTVYSIALEVWFDAVVIVLQLLCWFKNTPAVQMNLNLIFECAPPAMMVREQTRECFCITTWYRQPTPWKRRKSSMNWL